jgi:hypothetical protein
MAVIALIGVVRHVCVWLVYCGLLAALLGSSSNNQCVCVCGDVCDMHDAVCV